MLLFTTVLVNVLFAQSPIPAPTNLTLTPVYSGDRATVKLAWTAPAGIIGLKYNIYRKDMTGGTTATFVKKYSGISGVTYSDAAVTRGKSYAYYVVAYKNSAFSAPSDTQQITLAAFQYSAVQGNITVDNGGPLFGVKVQVIAFLNSTPPPSSFVAITDSLGNYRIKLLPGKYALYFAREGYIPEYFNNKATLALADSIVLTGADTATADAALALETPPSAPANLAATVINTTYSAQVKLTWEATNQNPAVKYAVYRKVGGLNDTGVFKKRFSGISQTNCVDMQVQRGKTYSYYVVAYKGIVVSEPSNTVEAIVGPLTYAWIYGVVTGDSTGLPIRRANVSVIPVATPAGVVNGPGECMNMLTDSLGRYAIRVTPGQYAIYFCAPGMVSEYYNNKTTLQLADKLTLATNDSVAADAGLAYYIAPPMYYLTGKVTDGSNNAKTAWVTIFRLRSNTFHYSTMGTRTDSLGNYKIKVKVGDTVVVFAQSMDHTFLPEYYNNKRTFAEADRIGVTGNVADINFVLETKPVFPNGISGVAADSAGLGVLSHVAAYKVKANGQIEKSYSVMAASATTGEPLTL
ncbi:MAG: hypothetical protein HYV28_08175 [Ignavibacteriales bacterium]|nr:hypothetical protein [Ignavibacteriales bacterium]